MARGDFIVFNEFLIFMGEKLINLETDDFRLALIDAVITPLVDTSNPTWEVGSSQDYDGNEVSTGGGYPAGGMVMSGPELIRATAVATFDDDDTNFSLSQNGSGFTDAKWGILYSFTATLNNAVGFLDLGTALSEVAGPLNFNINASGILTITRT